MPMLYVDLALRDLFCNYDIPTGVKIDGVLRCYFHMNVLMCLYCAERKKKEKKEKTFAIYPMLVKVLAVR